MNKTIIKTIACVAVPFFLLACSEKQEPVKMPMGNAKTGYAIASESCSACHGMDGKGVTADIPNLAAQVEAYLVAALNAYKDGKRSHAALRDMASHMSDQEIENVATFYAALPPVKSVAVAPTLPIQEKGKEAAQVCAACHGADGNSTKAGIPTLAGQQPEYFISAVNAYLDGSRKMATKEKEAMIKALNQVDIESMALYFAQQQPAQRTAPPVGNIAAGEPLSAECGACHGEKGVSSDPKIPSLAGQDAQYLVDAIKAYQDDARHQEDMHKTLAKSSHTDIEHIAAFYSVQRSRPAEDDNLSIKAIADKCDHCHAPGMENPMMIFPKIRGQNREYLVKALQAYRDNQRGSSPMHKMSLPYNAAVIESIAAWYANQPAR